MSKHVALTETTTFVADMVERLYCQLRKHSLHSSPDFSIRFATWTANADWQVRSVRTERLPFHQTNQTATARQLPCHLKTAIRALS
jgi:hypothetical protein